MRILKVLVILAVVCGFASPPEKKAIKVAESVIHWRGTKVIGDAHFGEIKFKKGYLEFEGGKLKGGVLEADMTTIDAKDIDGYWKNKLDAHLKSEDFFSVRKYPTSKLQITAVKEKSEGIYTVEANFKIKAMTKPVTFEMKTSGDMATTKLVIDRTQYDVRYGSKSFFDNLGDRVISDDFDIEVTLKY